ncbi:hypothetical protein, partial [Sansalvadorimonas verongulae]|uniref:hypothetical protein n=1 Tax=Sansalvadorimonas verongulae TaxID=2172824 RepID=UPI001E5FD62B
RHGLAADKVTDETSPFVTFSPIQLHSSNSFCLPSGCIGAGGKIIQYPATALLYTTIVNASP